MFCLVVYSSTSWSQEMGQSSTSRVFVIVRGVLALESRSEFLVSTLSL